MHGLRHRPLTADDQRFLWEMLHIALWDPPPAGLRPREALDHPDVRIYAEGWGRDGDVGVVAETDADEASGACWVRLLPEGRGLAWIDRETPQLGIALLPTFQGQGHGAPMIHACLDACRTHGHPQVALTVHPENPARGLYARCGYEDIGEKRGGYRQLRVML